MIRIQELYFGYGGKSIFDGFTRDLGPVTCITGPSGCGKTTLLRLIAGFEKPDSGTIAGVPERVSVLFQEDRLLPWHSARRNVEAVLAPDNSGAAAEWLQKTELGDFLDSSPNSLSGGQRRRVALARALAYAGETPAGEAPGALLILDEPFKGLDPALTGRMTALILSQNIPVIAAVHSPEEIALFGGDVIKLG